MIADAEEIIVRLADREHWAQVAIGDDVTLGWSEDDCVALDSAS